MLRLSEPCLESRQLALRFEESRAVLIVFEANQDLIVLYLVALFDADPGDFAHDFGSQFDLMRRDDVSGRIEDHVAFAARRNNRSMHANDFDLGGGVQLAKNESRGAKQDKNGDARQNPADGPGGG